MANCLILGASRGIGRELARQYAAAGDRVIATVRRTADASALRDGGAARVVEVDLAQSSAVEILQAALADEPLDVAIIAAGVSGPVTTGLAAPTAAEFDAVMHANVYPAMQVIPLLAYKLAATHGKLALLSSRMGSIGSMTEANWWLYRASKAALNAVLKCAAVELGPRGVVCMALHPGWVRTDMGGPNADLGVEESAAALRRVIAAANSSHNGRFLNFTGEQIEW